MKTKDFAKKIRKEALKMVWRAKASHIGGALSMADILAVLYNEILNFDSNNPKWEERDRLLLSKGHTCTTLYATLALKNFFPLSDLEKYAQNGSLFQSHTNHKIPGIEMSAGSLGHLLPVACGLAYVSKKFNKKWNTYCIVGDGELDEGSNWESILFAPQHKLDNLILIIDYNKIQSLGFVKEVIDLDPLKLKFEAFNWNVFEINGHSLDELSETFKNCPVKNNKPTVIIAHTIKGKGVDFMENSLAWHYKNPNDEELKKALIQIDNE
jgi:transketolase